LPRAVKSGKPGQRKSYSNKGYNLLGRIIEGRTKQSYGQYLKKNIFGPLKMLSTGCEQAGQLVRNRASGYTTDRNGRWVKEPPIDMSCAYAAGGLTHKIADIYLTDK